MMAVPLAGAICFFLILTPLSSTANDEQLKETISHLMQEALLQVLSEENHASEQYAIDFMTLRDEDATISRSKRSVSNESSASDQMVQAEPVNSKLPPVPRISRWDETFFNAREISRMIDVMQTLHSRLNDESMYLRHLFNLIKNAIRRTHTPTLYHHQILRDLVSFKSVHMKAMRGLHKLRLQGTKMTIKDLQIKTSDLKKAVSSMKQLVALIESTYLHVAFTHQPTVMSGSCKMNILHAYVMNSTALAIGGINGVDMNHLMANTFYLNKPKPILGRKFFPQISVFNSLSGIINGIDLSKAVLNDRPNMISAPVSLNTFYVHGDLRVSSINGLDIVRDTINLKAGSFIVASPVIFNGFSTTVDYLTTSRINSLNLDTFLRDIMVSDVEQRISSPIIIRRRAAFRQPVGNAVFNGLDLKALAADLIRLDRPVIHLGSKVFARPVRIVNELIVNSTINGLRVPQDFFLTSVPQTVIAPKRFVGHQTFTRQITAKGPVDGLQLPQDIVTLTASDPLPPVVFAKGLDVFSSMTAAGLVDSVDLSRLAFESIKAAQGILLDPVFSGPVFVKRDITLTGLLNGNDISSIHRDIILRHQTGVIPIRGTKVFASVTCPFLQVDTINGYPLSAFASVRGSEYLPLLSLVSARFNQTQVATGTVGGVNIPQLYSNRISLSIPGFLPANMNFIHELRVSQRLTVTGTVQNLVPTRDLVLKSAHQEIIGLKRFTNLRVPQHLLVRNSLNCRNVDQVNVTWVQQRRITLSQPQVIDQQLLLADSQASSLMSPIVNEIVLRDFIPQIMLKSLPQVIFGSKTFYSIFTFGDIITARGINGIYLPQVDKRAIHLYGNTFIYQPLSFADSLVVRKNVMVNGLINNISLLHFLSDVLMKDSRTVIRGPLTLMAPLTVLGKIECPRVNSMWLPQVILLKNYDQTIRSNVSLKNVIMKKSLSLGGNFNGIDLEKYDRSIMKLNRPNTFAGDLIFNGPVIVNSDVHVKGLVSGIDVRRVALQTLYKAFDQTINGATTIEGPVLFTGNLRIGNFNNRNLLDNFRSMVHLRSGSAAVITHPVTFSGDFIHTHSNVISNARSTVIKGATNNVLLAQLFDSLVYTNRPSLVSGPIRFNDDTYARSTVDIAGRLNNIDLYNDVLFQVAHPSGKAQVLSAPIQFASLWCESDLDVAGLVNGLHLPTFMRDSLLDYGSQRITGRKYFTGSFVIGNDSRVTNLNNITNIANELVPLNRFQYFKGHVEFVNPINVVGDVSVGGSLGGYNLTDLVKYSLYKNIPQSITGQLEFDKLVFYSNVSTAGPVNQVYLKKFQNDVHTYARSVRTVENIMSSIIDKQLRTNSLMYDSLVTSPYELTYFDLQQTLPGVHGNYFETQGKSMYSISQLDSLGVNSTVHQIRYKRENEAFESYKVESNVPFIKRVFFSLAGRDFSVHRASYNSEVVTEIRVGPRVVATLDPYIDDFTVLVTKEMAVIASLLGLKGQIKVHTLRYVGDKLQFNHVALLKVGPSAHKMVLFVDDRKLFLAVARSFRGQCSVSDYGSLLFQFIGNTFKLVQRIPVNDGHHVVHYQHRKRHYLAFSDAGSHYDFEESPGIHVFYMKNGLACHLMPFAKLHFDNVRDLTVVSFGPMDRESILLAAINSTTLTVWKQEGVFGFARSWSMPVSNGQAVYPVSAGNQLYLVASQGNKCAGSLVFKAVFSGASLKPLVFQRHWSSIS